MISNLFLFYLAGAIYTENVNLINQSMGLMLPSCVFKKKRVFSSILKIFVHYSDDSAKPTIRTW